MSEDNKKRKAPEQPSTKEHKTKSSATNNHKKEDPKKEKDSKNEKNESPGFQFINFTGGKEDQENDPELKFETHYESLHPVIKRRVAALEKLQEQMDDIQGQYNAEYFKLLSKYDKLYEPVFKKRSDVVVGSYEPKNEDLPKDYQPEPEQSKAEEVKGIPEFWFHVLLASPLAKIMLNDDEKILSHLTDIRTPHLSSEDFALEFHFDKANPYFENLVLKRTFHFELDPYGQRHINKTTGTPIKWKSGHENTESELFTFLSKPDWTSKKKEGEEGCGDEDCDDEDCELESWHNLADWSTTLRDVFVPSPVIWFKAPIQRELDPFDEFEDEIDEEDDEEQEEPEEEEEEQEEEKPKRGKASSRGKPNKN